MKDYTATELILLVLSHLLTVFGFLLALFLLAHLLKQRRTPASTVAWLLAIVLLPYVGVPLYLMFGGRKIGRMAARKQRVYPLPRWTTASPLGGTNDRILQSYGVPPATAGNRVALITSGVGAYEHLVELIDQAQRSIWITTYILGRDPVGKSIVHHLAQRAEAGVEVRLLLDSLGSWRINRRFLAPLLQAGAQVRFFMPVVHLSIRDRANLRNHRKIAVMDGRRAMVGGMNIARSYMSPTDGPGLWQDLSLILEGPAVRDLADLFRSDWRFASGEDLPPIDDAARAIPSGGDGTVQVVASGPDVVDDPLYECLIAALFAATQRVWVVTPYFIPDETLIRALSLAARRGVDVRLIVPERSNHAMADLARGGYLRQLHDSGGQVLLYRPRMLHAKAVLVDETLAVVGSANMDVRSLFLNYEIAAFVYSRRHVEEVAGWMAGLMDDCVPGPHPPGRARELAEDLARLLSPLL